MSEVSPIKAELETIIGQKTGSLQRTSVKPIVITTKTVKEAEEVMVPASEEEEEQAQKAAVKAIEVAFMRKRMAANAAAPNDESVEGETGGPVPATRRSIKRRDLDPR